MRRLVFALFALLFPALALAQTGEGLMVILPPGWVPLDQVHDAHSEEVYLVPPDQKNANWRDMLVYREAKGYTGDGPRKVLEGSLAAAAAGCPSLIRKPIQEGVVNGYPAAFLMVSCPSDPRTNRGEVNLVKVVQGKENLYLVQRTWRTQPFDVDHPPIDSRSLDTWVTYLSRLKPCDTRDPQHPCPKPEGATPPSRQ